METEPLGAFHKKFRVQELLIQEFSYWVWSVRPVQSTLGSGILSLRRYASRFSEVTADEMSELALVVQTIESRLQKAFRFEKMNYLMLMMIDPHVHFHVIPRYGSVKQFAALEWKDEGWPGLPVITGDPAEASVLHSITRALSH